MDTPGQIELFAFRASGPYFAMNLHADDKATIFALDGMLVSSPINFVFYIAPCVICQTAVENGSDKCAYKERSCNRQVKKYHGVGEPSMALEHILNSEKDAEYSLLTKDLAQHKQRWFRPES